LHIGTGARLSGGAQSRTGKTIMGKGNKQTGSREAKKPKADKKVIAPSASFLRPQGDGKAPLPKPSK
jgi:hypothetical protein